jgi:hypothetical protein
MTNPAMNDSSNICVDSATLCFAGPNGANECACEPKPPQPRTKPAGTAAQWWDSHPADLPQSTVLWIDDEAPGGSACERTENDRPGCATDRHGN